MPLQSFFGGVQRSLRLRPSVGSRLFCSVLGITLFGLGGTSYLLYRHLEQRSTEAIQLHLLGAVESVRTDIRSAEQLMQAASSGYRSLDRQGIRGEAAYQALALDLYKTRSSPQVIWGVGFGGGRAIGIPQGAKPTALHPWPYLFEHDHNDPEPVGQQLAPPHQAIRYADVCAIENCVQQDYYRKPVAAGQAIWLDAYEWHGKQFTTLTQPIYDDRKTMIGLVGIDLNLTDLTQKLDRPVVSAGYFTLLSDAGKVLAHPKLLKDPAKNLSFQEIDYLKDVWGQMSQGDRGLLRHQGHYLAYHRVPGPNWVMVAIVPEYSVIKPVVVIVLGSAIAIGGLLAGVLWLFTRRLNRRLQPILATCRQMTLLQQGAGRGQGDELDELASAFNDMTQQLKESFCALEQANQELEQRVDQRTVELSQALHDLQQAQSQLIQSEKMSSLGQLVAGIAHEVNNPITFIHGNLKYALDAMEVMGETIALYQKQYPETPPAIKAYVEEHDLEFVIADLPNMFESMNNGTRRVQTIVQSLRNFSRLDESGYKPVNLHEGLESTLLILHHRLNPQGRNPIKVTQDYGELPPVSCYPGQINQVFLNILTNAIEALEQHSPSKTDRQLHLQTRLEGDQVVIRIANNGPRIPAEIMPRLFDPFFTTKPVGQGTGMGLAVSYQVVEHHGGLLALDNPQAEALGTCFRIQLPIECRQIATAQSPLTTAVAVV